MDDPLESTAEETIRDLTIRLRRLEYLLFGPNPPTPESLLSDTSGTGSASMLTRENSILARLSYLDKSLGNLYNRSPTVRNILDLYVQFPDLFHTPHLPTPLPHHLFPSNPSHPTPLTLTPTEKLSIILSTASTYHSFSSQLNSIMDSPIPNPSTSTEIISLIPTINKVELLQEAHLREMDELRKRTAGVLEKWYLVGVEGVNECFAEWDERTLEVDRWLGRKSREAGET